MSWSHTKTGTPSEVVESLAPVRRLACSEPEQGFKKSVLDLIEDVMVSYPHDTAVVVSVSGSQSVTNDGGKTNSLSLSISAKVPQ